MSEPLDVSHQDGLWRAAQAKEIWRWTTHTADSRVDFEEWVATRLSDAEAGKRYTFATIDAATGDPIGSSTLHHYRPHCRVIEVGSIWLAPAFWRGGANIEAKLLMMTYAFEQLGCIRVEFKTDARNERSRAACLRSSRAFCGSRPSSLESGSGTQPSTA